MEQHSELQYESVVHSGLPLLSICAILRESAGKDNIKLRDEARRCMESFPEVTCADHTSVVYLKTLKINFLIARFWRNVEEFGPTALKTSSNNTGVAEYKLFFLPSFYFFWFCSKIRQRAGVFEMLWNVFAQCEYQITTVYTDWDKYINGKLWASHTVGHVRGSMLSLWPMTNHIRENISGHRGHCGAHTQIHTGMDISAFQNGKYTIRSSTHCLRILSYTHTHTQNTFVRTKSNSTLLLSHWWRGLICNRQRDSGCGN